ncbi:MAG: Holliday junction branch migration protein RuvA, partial [Candidatus Hydrogenedentes bacterium]|nr:Holliday junction branch migration protein RuvA [Candidatus Hydrogenedentota bacterium]
MFAFLRGTVARKPANAVELDVNGVGYLVHVPDA